MVSISAPLALPLTDNAGSLTGNPEMHEKLLLEVILE